jgi:hypothetical protein
MYNINCKLFVLFNRTLASCHICVCLYKTISSHCIVRMKVLLMSRNLSKGEAFNFFCYNKLSFFPYTLLNILFTFIHHYLIIVHYLFIPSLQFPVPSWKVLHQKWGLRWPCDDRDLIFKTPLKNYLQVSIIARSIPFLLWCN